MIRLALVGCGGMGHAHAQQLKDIEDASVVAFCDTIGERAAAYREKYSPDAAEYDSYDKMLDDDSLRLDGVVIVTPHAAHYPQAKAALRRGLHVLVEKPMVTRSQDAYDLWSESSRAGKLLGIAFQSPYTPEFAYLAGARDRGELGTVQLISGWVTQNWFKGTINKWRQDPEISGGGYMYDTGAHLLNAIMWLMNDPVVEVSCMYNTMTSPVDINGVAILRFQNGAMGSVTLGGNVPAFGTELQMMTDRMFIVTNQYGARLEIRHGEKRVYPHVEPPAETAAAGTPALNFIRAIQGSEPLRVPPRYGVLLSALMDAMYESAQKRRPVEVTPVPSEI